MFPYRESETPPQQGCEPGESLAIQICGLGIQQRVNNGCAGRLADTSAAPQLADDFVRLRKSAEVGHEPTSLAIDIDQVASASTKV
jgi:hypothetical protein